MKLPSPILTFMLASAGVHAALVMTSNNPSDITLPGSTGSVMTVKVNKAEPVSKKNLKKIIQPEITQQNKKIAANLKKHKKQPQKDPVSDHSYAKNEHQQAESKAQVISIIYDKLSQYFIYPKLAQKRNWQGKVLLSLRVSSNGKINNVQINRSSGYSVLDQAAVNSLMKIGSLPQLSSWLPYEIDLKLPVVYQLTES